MEHSTPMKIGFWIAWLASLANGKLTPCTPTKKMILEAGSEGSHRVFKGY